MYPEYANNDDRKCAKALINAAISANPSYTISIWEGEDHAIENSRDTLDILKAMSSTGEDWVEIYNDANECIGQFYLIYDNGSEDEPMILITDYSNNELCNAIYNVVDKKYG